MHKLIFLTIAGSRAYGNYTETSDYDFRGVYVSTTDYYLGIHKKKTPTINDFLKDIPEEYHEKILSDNVIYDLRDFCILALNSNPNILELLFMDNIINDKNYWNSLIKHRDFFLSKKVIQTFSGYALSQLKKIKSNDGSLLKHASHLVRLFYEAKQLLNHKKLIFPLPEIEHINNIRAGNESINYILNMAEHFNADLKYIITTLPEVPDEEVINFCFLEITKHYTGELNGL